MVRLGREVVRPQLHEHAAPVEQIGPGTCLLNAAAKLMRQSRLTDCPGCVRLFHGPSLEGRSETVHGRAVGEVGFTKYLDKVM